ETEITSAQLLGYADGVAIVNKIVKAKAKISKATHPFVPGRLVEIIIYHAIILILPIRFAACAPTRLVIATAEVKVQLALAEVEIQFAVGDTRRTLAQSKNTV